MNLRIMFPQNSLSRLIGDQNTQLSLFQAESRMHITEIDKAIRVWFRQQLMLVIEGGASA